MGQRHGKERMSEDIIAEVADGIATLTFNRPKALNALNDGITDGAIRFVEQIERDAAVRCLVIRGAGDHFMAGGDLKRFQTFLAMSADERRLTFEREIAEVHRLILMLRRMAKPVIASVQGACAGFGLSLAMATDLIVAAENAYFTLAYVNIGATPDGSGSYFLPRLVGLKKAMEIALLGDRFDAATAARIGIVNFVVPPAELEAATAKLAGRLARGPAIAIGRTKALLNASLERSLESELQAEADSFAACATTDDWAEGIRAFIEKRKPAFAGR